MHRIVIAEDEGVLRAGLASLLAGEGYAILATVSNATDLVATVTGTVPDLVITDIRMPPGNARDGIEAALALRGQHPDLAVLVLSQHVDSIGATDLLSGGGKRVGYLLKQRIIDIEPFLAAVRTVLDGGSVVDPEVVKSLIRRRHRDNPIDRLSPRRRETLELMAQGMSNARIAEQLVITEKAVARNIAVIFAELGLPPSPDDHRRVLAVIRFLNR